MIKRSVGRPPKRAMDGRPTKELVCEAARDPWRTVNQVAEWINGQFDEHVSVSEDHVRRIRNELRRAGKLPRSPYRGGLK